jgi:hypothetical protein
VSDSLFQRRIEAQLVMGAYRNLAQAWAYVSLAPGLVLWLLAGTDAGFLGYLVGLAWALAAALAVSFLVMGERARRRAERLGTDPAVHEARASWGARAEAAVLGIALAAGAVLAWGKIQPGALPGRLTIECGHAWAVAVTLLAARFAIGMEAAPGRRAKASKQP